MNREIEVEFEKGGKFVAKLLEEKAPETCQSIWEHLPIEGKVIHARWSGACIYLNVDFRFGKPENLKRICKPGSLTFDTHHIVFPEGAYRPTPCEINFIYDTSNLAFYSQGYPAMVNHFADITKGDLSELRKIGQRVQREGMEGVVIRKNSK